MSDFPAVIQNIIIRFHEKFVKRVVTLDPPYRDCCTLVSHFLQSLSIRQEGHDRSFPAGPGLCSFKLFFSISFCKETIICFNIIMASMSFYCRDISFPLVRIDLRCAASIMKPFDREELLKIVKDTID